MAWLLAEAVPGLQTPEEDWNGLRCYIRVTQDQPRTIMRLTVTSPVHVS